MKAKSCGSCALWNGTSVDVGYMRECECRAKAPSLLKTPTGRLTFAYPHVRPDHWCGEYLKRTAKTAYLHPAEKKP